MKKTLLSFVKYGLIALFSVAIGACAWVPRPHTEATPIVLLHGAGASGAFWQDLIWRLESSGWPREQIFALNQPYPLAADTPSKEQAGRSTPAQTLLFLTTEVERVRQSTGVDKVILIGHGQGALAIETYMRQKDSAAHVSRVVLSGGSPAPSTAAAVRVPTPAASSASAPAAAASASGSATVPMLFGVPYLAMNPSDKPFGGFDAQQFQLVWQFLTGQAAAVGTIWPQYQVVLDGRVTGMGLLPSDPANPDSYFINNLPMPQARVEVYAVSAETGLRLGGAVFQSVANHDGRWGPFKGFGGQAYEFVVRAQGYAITHVYRSGFERSSNVVHLRASRIGDDELAAFGILTLDRPAGGLEATMRFATLDGQSPPPRKLLLQKAASRTVKAQLHVDEIESVAGRTWSAKDNHLVRLEFSH